MANGIIKRYDFRKGFGFIVDDENGEDFFFHKSEWQGDGPIRKGLAVRFLDRDSEKGPQAESVTPLDGTSIKASNDHQPTAQPVSLEDRVAFLEDSLNAWRILSGFALAGVVALAVAMFLL